MKDKLVNLCLILCLIPLFACGYYLYSYDSKEIIKETINFSSEKYKDIDLWKDNITFQAINQKGELITGKEWFGVNGDYSEERHLIFGDNYYTYWVENDSYIVIPQKLIPDINDVKQKVIAQAYKIR